MEALHFIIFSPHKAVAVLLVLLAAEIVRLSWGIHWLALRVNDLANATNRGAQRIVNFAIWLAKV